VGTESDPRQRVDYDANFYYERFMRRIYEPTEGFALRVLDVVAETIEESANEYC